MKYLLPLLLLFSGSLSAQESLTFGSKPFTESTILSELLAQIASQNKFQANHKDGLGGTGVLWTALVNGEIDAYVEYTGTLQFELFAKDGPKNFNETLVLMKKQGVSATAPFGFNNTYAIGIPEELAAERNIKTISDLAKHPDIKYGFTNDFIDREDGWKKLREPYGLSNDNVKGLDHALAYEAIAGGSIHVMDMYSTDAQIKQYNLRTLIDDKSVFPEYKAIIVYRTALEKSHPTLITAFRSLEGQITDSQMVDLNARVIVDKLSES
ncbi:MAG: glycine betaine ABC transporter substrate-binding protein, partial [Planctomycetota bacterium]